MYIQSATKIMIISKYGLEKWDDLMLEAEEFFQRFNSGFNIEDWIAKMENKTWATRTQKYYDKNYMMVVTEYKERFANLEYDVNCLVIVEDACWDCQFYVPILIRLAEHNPKVNVKLVYKHENMDILQKTNGGNKSPYVMFYSEDGYFIDRWAERPTEVYDLIGAIRKEVGFGPESKKTFVKEYRKRFLKNQEEFYRCAAEEFSLQICRAHSIQATSPRINEQRESTTRILLEAEI